MSALQTLEYYGARDVGERAIGGARSSQEDNVVLCPRASDSTFSNTALHNTQAPATQAMSKRRSERRRETSDPIHKGLSRKLGQVVAGETKLTEQSFNF